MLKKIRIVLAAILTANIISLGVWMLFLGIMTIRMAVFMGIAAYLGITYIAMRGRLPAIFHEISEITVNPLTRDNVSLPRLTGRGVPIHQAA
jgi:hypothetical protein